MFDLGLALGWRSVSWPFHYSASAAAAGGAHADVLAWLKEEGCPIIQIEYL